ncbi:MAG: hypothetical protein ACRBCI_05880 [Cellvibrionaceae bacterium]
MQTTKKTAEYTVFKRADGRYAVKGNDKKFINGEDKVKILIAEGLLTAPSPKPAEPEAAEEASEETTAE